MSGPTVELDLYLVAETGSAYGVTADTPEDSVIWLPKSQVELQREVSLGRVGKFDVPEWLAEDRGLA